MCLAAVRKGVPAMAAVAASRQLAAATRVRRVHRAPARRPSLSAAPAVANLLRRTARVAVADKPRLQQLRIVCALA